MVKRTDGSGHFIVYHKDIGTSYLALNETWSTGGDSYWNGTHPTSTQFTVSALSHVNTSGAEYVCYLFAGGMSTNAAARSVKFDNDVDALELASSSDFGPGTGDFTWEAWIKPDDQPTYNPFWLVSGGLQIWKQGGNFKVKAEGGTTYLNFPPPNLRGVWTHFAVCRSGSTIKAFFNGVEQKSNTCTENFGSGAAYIGWTGSGVNQTYNGLISNLRWIKGTALYTSSFKPPTEPLTNVTNTKLLCCNNSSVTGSTVTPSTISAKSGSDITASTDSPFDDPSGYVFGEGGKENVIKCGSHSNSATEAVRIYTGWEPQWIMIKNTSNSSNWAMFDCMRGMYVDEDSPSLAADVSTAENGVVGSTKAVFPHADGFTFSYGLTAVNPGNGNNIIYIAIRREDPLVQKPIELATDVFTMDTGNGSSAGPCFDSNFDVDFALRKAPGSTAEWKVVNRLTGKQHLETNSNNAESSHNDNVNDFNNGWAAGSIGSNSQSWMWKRWSGFTTVAWEGDGVAGRRIAHDMSKIPEMLWVKNRDGTPVWAIYHKDLGNTDPAYAFWMEMASTNPEQPSSYSSGDTGQFYRAPTATHFSVNGPHNKVNADGDNYIGMLFSSVSGISSVGSYSGTGSSGHQISCGFQPRFILIKAAYRADGYGGGWHVFDTLRGINSGNEYPLTLNSDGAETAMNHLDYIDLDSNGFTIQSTSLSFNGSNARYIYYAHA